jgi:N-acetylglucosamine kinase-like BadF-type ATPase
MQPERDYQVGYGRPPTDTRFKKGQSGNPRGRPKKLHKNFATVFSEALNETVTLTDKAGRRHTVSKRELLAKQVINIAVKGDTKAMHLLLRLMDQIDSGRELKPPPLRIIRSGADARP